MTHSGAHDSAGDGESADRPTLGSLVRGYRMRSGLTQADLAARAGLSVRALRDLESGRSNRPHLGSIRRLAGALGLSPAEHATVLDRIGAAPAAPARPAEPAPPTVGILGPLTVSVGGRPVNPGPPMLRSLLGLLALHAPDSVPTDEIMAELWGDRPPRTARGQVHVRIGQLRRLLGGNGGSVDGDGVAVESLVGGYRLRTALDASTFHDLAARAERALTDGDRDGARDLYARALRLWRGPVLADVAGLRYHPVVAGITARRITATIAYADLVDAADRPEVVRWLRALAVDEPLHEGLAASLVLALAAGGEQAAALAVHDTMRARLADELGIEPGPELRAAHLRVLRQEDRSRPVPAQLPPAVGGFVGRAAALTRLDEVIPGAGTGDPTVVVVTGTAGVGKTTLAVRWAHRVVDRFPDGHLYVDLRGFYPDGPALDAAEAVRGFLDALAVPPDRIPDGLDARVGLYRSLLHRRRVLVILDNARDAEQVRPLLPGAPTSLTVVTSRSRLGGLIATAGAHLVPLDLLSPGEARDLLARRLGQARVDADPSAVAGIVQRCARLPLALAVVAAHAAGRPDFPLAAVAKDLATGSAGRGIGVVAGDVEQVLSWSYRGLAPAVAGLFRLLAVHPGPDIDVAGAASLLAAPVADARAALLTLVDAHLVTEHRPGRYAFHDLLRAYAGTLADEAETAPALRRTVDHYLRSLTLADALITPLAVTVPPLPTEPGVTPAHLTDIEQARAWLDAEYPVLLGVVGQAARAGLDAHVWRLGWLLWRYFEFRGRLRDWCDVQELALVAARRLGDPLALERTHRSYAYAYARLRRYDDAIAHLDHAAIHLRALDDPRSLARLILSRSWITGLRGDDRDALGYAERALAMFEELGERLGVIHALATAGRHLVGLGDPERALEVLTRAWNMHQDVEDPYGRADTLEQLGRAYLLRGEPRRAANHVRRAAALHREIGDRYAEADAHHLLGDAHEAMGDADGARSAWSAALLLLDGIGHEDAAAVRRKLARGVPTPRQKAAEGMATVVRPTGTDGIATRKT